MIPKPWQVDGEDYAEIPEYYPDYPFDTVVTTYKNFYHNSYLVPCVAIFVIYGLFLIFVLGSGVKQGVRHFYPRFGRGRWLTAYVTNHPLAKRSHAELVSLPGLRWLTLQLPLRGDAIVLLLIILANFLPLVAFYDWFIEGNVFWEGPTAKRDMLCRFIADRTALLGTACFPLLILFASKRTPVAILAHLDMPTLMLYHRWIARICWAHILIHTTAFSIDYARYEYLLEAFKEPYFQWGCVGFGMMCGLVFFSLRSLREKWYELFVFLHITMAVIAIVGVYLHIKLLAAPKLQMFVLMTELSAAFWAFDRVIRLATRLYFSMHWVEAKGLKCASAHVRAVGSRYMCLRIELPLSRLRFQGPIDATASPNMLTIGAGDDIRITVPRVQLVGEHPFTVLRTGKLSDQRGYLDLLVKTYGGLTRKLALRTKALPGGGEEVRVGGSKVNVLVEGPFGSAPSLVNAEHAVLVAGGIAITYCWPMFTAAARGCYPALKTCKLVWIVRHSDTVDVIEEALTDLIAELELLRMKQKLMLDIYVTAPSGASDNDATEEKKEHDADESHEMVETLPALARAGAGSGSSSSSEDVATPAKPITAMATAETLQALAAKSGILTIQIFTGRPESMSRLHAHIPAPGSEEHAATNEPEKSMDEIHFAACGPPSLCDDVRGETLALMRQNRRIRLSQDCFSY